MFAHAAEFSSPSFMTLGRLERRLHRMRFHMIDSSNVASLQRTDTKSLAHGPFLEMLRGQGHERARPGCRTIRWHRTTLDGRCEAVVGLNDLILPV
jgi:hypothetical protein